MEDEDPDHGEENVAENADSATSSQPDQQPKDNDDYADNSNVDRTVSPPLPAQQSRAGSPPLPAQQVRPSARTTGKAEC